jgi:hypothetical protein
LYKINFKEQINMKNLHNIMNSVFLVIVLAALSGIILLANPQTVYAQGHGRQHGGEFFDARHGHNHYYPARGSVITTLPRDHRIVTFRGSPYHYYRGSWYRSEGPRFFVVAPPIGLFIPFLPPYYETIWVGRIPYYYANDVYYVSTANGYEVVAPPPASSISQAQPAPPVAAADKLYIYPRSGQNEQKQADDRYQCHRWAVGQTNYDPTLSYDGTPSTEKRADYKRAFSACLDGKGYTVK